MKCKEYYENYVMWQEQEDAYVKSQILRNRKWHNFYFFLRWLLIGRD